MKIAVLLPCYNEGAAIYKVVQDFRAALPEAAVYVYDNNSTDNTSAEAARAGAVLRQDHRQGKGYIIQRMFADIDADIYIMADGDGTYDAAAAPALVEKLLQHNLDMVVGTRVAAPDQSAFRPGHRFGNKMMTRLVTLIFGEGFTDIFSGYRVLSRRFVKSFPTLSHGFEIETEISVHALTLKIPFAEVETRFFERAGQTTSKLRTYPDGLRILNFMILLFKEIRPFLFFGTLGLVLVLLSLALAAPVIHEYLQTGMVPRFPTAILSTAIMLSAFLSFTCGIILDSLGRSRLEYKRLFYLGCGSRHD